MSKKWHGATMFGFGENDIPQVLNAGWASWGTGIMNLEAAFGSIVEGPVSYNKSEMHYFALIKNPYNKR